MTVRQFFSILRARHALVAIVFLAVVAGVMAITAALPQRYKATTQVLVDVRSPDLATGQAANPGFVQGYMATQVDILTSQRVALRVVEMLDLVPAEPGVDPRVLELRRLRAADSVVRGLSVRPARDSSMLDVVFTDPDPVRAARVANAAAQAYIETTIRVKADPAGKTREFFLAQGQELRASLEEAQRRLATFQRAKGITSADERLDVETGRLNELSTQVTALQAATIESRRRQESAREGVAGGGGVGEVMQNPLVQTLKTDQARLEARLRERSAVLGPNHPEIVRVNEELASLRGRIAQESGSITESLTRSHRDNAQRLAELEEALAQQRGKVLQLRQTRSELALLQRDVDNAQKAYDAVQERLSQTTLESRSVNSNASVISAAEVPSQPSGPAPAVWLAVSVVLGALLATAAAIGLEALDRKVRSRQDLTGLDVPLLGTVRQVPRRSMRDRRGGRRGPRHGDAPFNAAG